MKIGSFTILVIGLIFMYHVEELDQKQAFEYCINFRIHNLEKTDKHDQNCIKSAMMIHDVVCNKYVYLKQLFLNFSEILSF